MFLTPEQNKKGRVLLERTQETKKMYKKTDLDQWARESMPILKKHGYLKEQVIEGSKNNWLLPAVFFVLGVALCIIFVYAINHDAFKTELNQNIEPNVSVENQYDFNPTTENKYEFTPEYAIYNNVIIPDNLCGGGSE